MESQLELFDGRSTENYDGSVEIIDGSTFTVLHNGKRIDLRATLITHPYRIRLNVVDVPRGETIKLVTK